MELRQYLAALKGKMWIPILLAATAIGIVLVDAVYSPPSYDASFTAVPYEPGILSDDAYISYQLVMESKSLDVAVANKVDPSLDPGKLRDEVTLKSDKKTGAYTFEVSDSDPGRAQRLAEAYNEEGTAKFLDLNTRKAKATIAAMQEEVQSIEKQLGDVRSARARMEKDNDVGSLPARLSHQLALVGALKQMRSEMVIKDSPDLSKMIQEEIGRQQATTNQLSDQVGQKEASTILSSTAEQTETQMAIDSLRARLAKQQDSVTTLEQYRAQARSGASTDATDAEIARQRQAVADLQNQLNDLVAKAASLSAGQARTEMSTTALRDELQRQNNLVASLTQMQLDAKLNNRSAVLQRLDAELAAQDKEANDLSALDLQYEQITTEEGRLQNSYAGFQARIDDALILDKATPASMVKLVEPITVKLGSSMFYLKIAFALALSLILALALIFTAEYLDNTVRTAQQIETMVGAPVLTVVPRFGAKRMPELTPQPGKRGGTELAGQHGA